MQCDCPCHLSLCVATKSTFIPVTQKYLPHTWSLDGQFNKTFMQLLPEKESMFPENMHHTQCVTSFSSSSFVQIILRQKIPFDLSISGNTSHKDSDKYIIHTAVTRTKAVLDKSFIFIQIQKFTIIIKPIHTQMVIKCYSVLISTNV